ncbi:hypothetical protein [Cytobacillus gottheilii]|uniref:hypothetical protein n=1 Tax=Cytobacillus gottheilii TaxID=859144 RepID=UPI0009BB8B3F|nr:hypothetical protein [Cytobacillus gottheilii]
MQHANGISGGYKEDHMIFDSEYEVEEWVESLYSDVVPYLANNMNVGCVTPEKKLVKSLENYLPSWADFNEVNIQIHSEQGKEDGKVIYKIWTQQLSSLIAKQCKLLIYWRYDINETNHRPWRRRVLYGTESSTLRFLHIESIK